MELLDNLKLEHPRRDINVRVGDANISVQHLVGQFVGRGRKGVAFLDPYGAHLHWRTVEALGKTGNVDVIINLPLGMAINRLVKLDGDIPQKQQDQLDKCFGTHDWYDRAYHTQANLFGDSKPEKRSDTARQLLDLYTTRLKRAFKAVSTPSLVTNTRGAPLYYLIWAGHPTGKGIAEHILRLGEKISSTRK